MASPIYFIGGILLYIDSFFDKKTDSIYVVERQNGKRITKTLKPSYKMYIPAKDGSERSVFDKPLTEITSNKFYSFEKLREQYGNSAYEGDLNHLFETLAETYRKDGKSAEPNVGMFDIEVDFDPKIGFSTPENPYAPINAISVYHMWTDIIITLVVPPKNISYDQAVEMLKDLPNCFVMHNEAELLDRFLTVIEDVDILSGWNSTFFDIPYIVGRIKMILGESETSRLCLWGLKPKERHFTMFKRDHITYDIVGRAHLDYLELYKKHTYQELHSYKLDNVGKFEVGEEKVPYEGTLDALYRDDFVKFVEYNQQDVMLLVKIDRKLRFIDLSIQLANSNGVLLQTTLGSVALIDQAIINEIHDRGMKVFNKRGLKADARAAGAYVADPVKGRHKFIGAVDINSLYPSTIRALNMSPETIFAQLRQDRTKDFIEKRYQETGSATEAWNGVFACLEYDLVQQKTDDIIVVDFMDGEEVSMTAKDIHAMIYEENNPLCMSANGTIFRTDIEGIIPGLLTRWYAERKDMQKKEKFYKSLMSGIELPEKILSKLSSTSNIENDKNVEETTDRSSGRWGRDEDVGDGLDFIKSAIKEENIDKIIAFSKEYNLIVSKNLLISNDKKDHDSKSKFWGQRQLARKILLNSLYGAILNEASRFFDPRIGQSVTLTGRMISRHMASKINDELIGEYTHKGGAIIYGDTDSCYFSIHGLPNYTDFDFQKDTVTKIYDLVADQVNDSFPEFMHSAFNTGIERGKIIKAGRELVAAAGIFMKKKRYAVLIYDLEGIRLDVDGKPGKIKAMGVETKRSDTPKDIQNFLEEILTMVLTDGTAEEVSEKIENFRKEFKKWDSWKMGRPTAAKGVSEYTEKMEASQSKIMVPGHIMAAINWNKMLTLMDDHYSPKITDGAKVTVCDLLPNDYNIHKIAYPSDLEEIHLPEWFKKLPFNREMMENSMIDTKIDNLLYVMNWDWRSIGKQSMLNDFLDFE
ncbi:MAG: DNA polymerase domain-containing protein [Candidimonas sp.]